MYGIFFTLVYLAASIQEWFFHKYLMHTPGFAIFDKVYQNHISHHRNTKSDYSIVNNNPEYICFEVFSLDGIIQMVVVFSINVGGFYILFHPYISLVIISITIAMTLFINIVVWNTYHAYVHGFDANDICTPLGVKRTLIHESNAISSWFINNHRTHHDTKKSNYNIVFPGADFIFGTYRNNS